MRFAAVEPVKVPLLAGKRLLDFSRTAEVFEKADDLSLKSLRVPVSGAIGCYVLALRPSGALRDWPYYVGQAHRQTLGDRVFQRSDKVEKFNDIVASCDYTRGTFKLYLFPLLTPSGRLARLGTNKALIDRAEFALIGLARAANEHLWNIKHRTGLDGLTIDGAFNSVSRTGPAKQVASMFYVA